MSAPVKPWEKSTGSGDLLPSSRSAGNEVMNSHPMYNLGLNSHSPMISLPAGSSPAPRRLSRSTVPMPPPPLAVGRMNSGYAANNYAGYGGGTYGNNAYGGYTGSYGANSYGGYGTSGYGGYGTSGYGGYGTTGFGGYGGTYGGRYGGMAGMGGYGMNRYNQQPMNNLESRFIQMAEESSRPTFESIESLVQTFGSVSFMMESTFGALYSSFRAVLGVAENFGRLRTVFGQVFSTFAVLRFFQWAYRKLLYYLGLRADNPGREAIWQQVSGGVGDSAAPGGAHRPMWPVALFLGLVCSGPYIMWKLLSSLNVTPVPTALEKPTNLKTWVLSNKPMHTGVVRYDFEARNEQEMSVRANQQLFVAPNDFQTGGRDWVMVGDRTRIGYVPSSYILVGQPVKVQFKKPSAGTKPASASDQPTRPQSPTTEPVIPQPTVVEMNNDLKNTQFPPLEQFIEQSSSLPFQPGDFEPKIGDSNEKIPGEELP